jgi:hypothetical protein
VLESEPLGDPPDAGPEPLGEPVVDELPRRRVVLEYLELRHVVR